MSDFLHLLLVRLNSPNLTGLNLEPQWFEERVKLFERFCLGSLKSQTVQAFTAMVVSDVRNSPDMNARLQKLQDEHGFYMLKLSDSFKPDDVVELLENWVAFDSYEMPPFLMTTRLDSDDAIANDFIELTQKQFRQQDRQSVIWKNGLELDLRNGRMVDAVCFPNPVPTFIEKVDMKLKCPTTVFGDTSKQAGCGKHEIASRPMWLATRHEWNCITKYLQGKNEIDEDKKAEHRVHFTAATGGTGDET